MGCATGMIKYLVFLFNLVFAVAGLAMLIVGILYKISLNDSTKSIDSPTLNVAPTLVIVVGAIVFIIAFFGCCGAIRESTCMLTTYAVILLVIFILQIAIGVFAFIQVKDNGGSFKKEINNALEKAYTRYNSDDITRDSINVMQQAVHCCGLHGPASFPGLELPSSCCQNNKEPCRRGDNSVFDQGCDKALYKSLKDSVEVLGYVALGLCATELIAAIFSLCLSSSIRNERRRGGYA